MLNPNQKVKVAEKSVEKVTELAIKSILENDFVLPFLQNNKSLIKSLFRSPMESSDILLYCIILNDDTTPNRNKLMGLYHDELPYSNKIEIIFLFVPESIANEFEDIKEIIL